MRLDEMPPADFNQEPEKSAFIAGGQAVIEVGTRRIRCLILPAQTFRPTGFVRHCPDESRTCFITRHVCDGGDVGCSSRRRVRSNMSILRGLPTKKCAQIAPSLRVAARTVGCCVTLLDHIDIWPSSGALHPVRPGHNASRA